MSKAQVNKELHIYVLSYYHSSTYDWVMECAFNTREDAVRYITAQKKINQL